MALRSLSDSSRGLGREHDFLAGGAQVLRQADPVGGAQLLAARTDRLAQIDAIDGRMLRGLGVELQHLGLGPEEEQGSQAYLHGGLHHRHGRL
jgi:hypothetical protein